MHNVVINLVADIAPGVAGAQQPPKLYKQKPSEFKPGFSRADSGFVKRTDGAKSKAVRELLNRGTVFR